MPWQWSHIEAQLCICREARLVIMVLPFKWYLTVVSVNGVVFAREEEFCRHPHPAGTTHRILDPAV